MQSVVLRVARPTEKLAAIAKMYERGLGFAQLGCFVDHEGFDGIMVGHSHFPYHLEFTSQRGHTVSRAPSQDQVLVFYVPDRQAWLLRCEAMERAGFQPVSSYNPYWDRSGRTFEDLDGYRVVIQNAAWER